MVYAIQKDQLNFFEQGTGLLILQASLYLFNTEVPLEILYKALFCKLTQDWETF